MERSWTAEQKSAIEARGGSLLVSAAAGSGKTAVLVERLLRLITGENGCDADRLLVVTFTNAAAAELKERVSRRLAESIAQNPLDQNLQRQQMLLQNAHISTIHSFCLDLLRAHFEALDLPPDFRIADENEGELLRGEVLDDLFEECYAAARRGGDDAFARLSALFSTGRGDAALAETVLRLHDFVRSLDAPEGFLDTTAAMYAPRAAGESVWGRAALAHAAQVFAGAARAERAVLARLDGDEKTAKAYAPAFESDCAAFASAERAARAGNWDETVRDAASFSFARLGAARGGDEALKTEAKAVRDASKKALEKLLGGVLCCTEEEFGRDLAAQRPLVARVTALVRELDARFSREKRAKGLLDFSDLEQLALKLLARREAGGLVFTQVAQALSERFAEVLVDEFQDVSPVQDGIFRAVSDGGRKLFLVGDVKQSIYGFRQARPELFLARRNACAPYGAGRFPAKIILGRNFRSREGVTEAVNFVFGRLMTRELGGVDYGPEEELVPGAAYFPREGPDFALHVLDRGDGGEGEAEDESAAELEARHIAGEIARKMAQGFPVQGENGPRPAEYRDFCILLRSMQGRAEIYLRALEAAGIPAYAQMQNGYLGAYEVNVMLSLLRILDNPLQDIPLLSVLLSPVFGFTPDDAALLRIRSRRGSLYLSLLALSKGGDARFDAFLATLSHLRALAAVLPADRLILRIYDETGFLDVFTAMPGGELREANLRLLLDYARSYEAAGYRGLAGFLRFIDRVSERRSDLSPASAIPESADVVRVMSIHKSKGLEFPVVFLAGCAKRFNNEDAQRTALFHPSCGYGSMALDEALGCRTTTLPREAVKLELTRSMLSEEMRVLYVAMTRAKEFLCAVETPSRLEPTLRSAAAMAAAAGNGKVPAFEAMAAQSPGEWLLAAALLHPSGGALRARAGFGLPAAPLEAGQWELCVLTADEVPAAAPAPGAQSATAPAGETEEALRARLTRQMSGTYPHEGLAAVPSKVSVSELAEAGIFRAEQVRPAFLAGAELTAAEAGTALHAFLQYAQLSALRTREGAEAELARLESGRFLLPEQARAVEIGRVLHFSQTPLFSRLLRAQRLWREFRFNFELPAEEVFPQARGVREPVLLQGMADLVFLEDGKAVLLDYKTDHVKAPDELAARYRAQLALYARAVREILGCEVAAKYLYSFALGREIEV